MDVLSETYLYYDSPKSIEDLIGVQESKINARCSFGRNQRIR
jgi:hypothetical protein